MVIILRFQLLFLSVLLISLIAVSPGCDTRTEPIKVGVFEINATPAIDSPVAYAKARSIVDSLFAKGVIILSQEKPIVLCVVDWLGIANEAQDAWRESLARAAGTSVDRVSVHAVHQHDGRRCDFTTAGILDEFGLGGWRYDTEMSAEFIRSAAKAVAYATQNARAVTHLGFGEAKVEKVASNRRILGTDGKVEVMRFSSSQDSAAIAAPEGLIDPWLKCVSFWDDDQPVVVLNYYATHPMSHYGKGDVSSDFVGIARERREMQLGVPNLYFTGAAGNIAAGKYNDGSPERREILAERMQKAMRQAWEQTHKTTLSATDLQWNNIELQLPVAKHLQQDSLTAQLEDTQLDSLQRFTAAKQLAWLRRNATGHTVNISALKLADVWLLNIPGEACVEYQLAAQEMKPGDRVCTAAYEEYGSGYICPEIAYSQGGYESSRRASFVAPEVEPVLLGAIAEVLK